MNSSNSPSIRTEAVLRPSKKKFALLLIVGLAFVAMGVFILRSGDLFLGLSCTVLFGLGAAIFAVQLRPGASYLKLTPEGFEVCSLYRVARLVRWSEVSTAFRVVRLPPQGHRMVVYDSTVSTKQGLRNINRGLVGASDGLPDTYGLKPQALADLMNEWRLRYGGV